MNYLCPGYNDVFENRHRDETAKVVKRNWKHIDLCNNVCSGLDETRRSPFSRQYISGIDVSINKLMNLVYPSAVSPSISSMPMPDTEYAALSFFFHVYGAGRDTDATCSWLDLLPGMYAACRPYSPLSLATTALAIRITTLWTLRDVDSEAARQRYAQAVIGAREAILDPIVSRSNELVMATLVLEAYDSITSYYRYNQTGVHTSGAIALVKHRGSLNYRDDISRRIVVTLRSKLVQDSLVNPQDVRDLHFVWKDDFPVPQSFTAELDRLAYRLAQLSGLMRGADRSAQKVVSGTEVNDTQTTLFSQVIALAHDCTRWMQTLPYHWHSVAVDSQYIDETIKAAGVHGTSCDVYANLTIASVRNWHRIVELRVLQLLRQCQASQDSHNDSPSTSVEGIQSRIQRIMDEICASVPYHVGDMMEPTSPILGAKPKFPHVRTPDAAHRNLRSLPESMSRHEHQMASSGAMILYRVLTTVIGLARDGTDDYRIVLPHDQMEWIMVQYLRIQKLLNFSLSR